MKFNTILALSFLSFSAMAGSVDQATVEKLNSTQFSCQLDRLEMKHGLEKKTVFEPEHQVIFKTSQWGKDSGKCLLIPTSEEGKGYMPYGCVTLNEKTVIRFDDKEVKVKSEKAGLFDTNNWGSFKIDLKTGEGSYEMDAHFGWHPYTKDQDHITAKFSHCEIVEN